MKNNITNEEIKKILESVNNIRLDQAPAQRIKGVLLSQFENLENQGDLKNNHFNENRKVSIFNSLMLKPMIPILIALIIFAGTTGTVVAAENSKPGDALFGVERAWEQTQLNFSLSDEAKAERWLKIAQEREQEQKALLISNQTDEANTAEGIASNALQNAQEVIARVKAKHEENGREQASESLNKVEHKLQELSDRFEERKREQTERRLENEFGSTDLEVEVEDGQARINLEAGGKKYEYSLETSDTQEIVDSIQEKTGISTEDVRTLIKIDNHSNSDNSSDNAANDESNTNQSPDSVDGSQGDDSADDSSQNINDDSSGQDQPDSENTNSNENINDDQGDNGTEDSANENENRNTNQGQQQNSEDEVTEGQSRD
ncbi:MAG: DUF5667 domain-containing protein [Patescibacteria group bacterium]|jgi:hypothetical protein